MRANLLRFRTATLYILIALIAITLGVTEMRKRRDSYEQKADFHSYQYQRLTNCKLRAAERLSVARRLNIKELIKVDTQDLEELSALATYHLQLKRKYDDATRRPWRSVSIDPPLPPDPFPFDELEWKELRLYYPWLPAENPQNKQKGEDGGQKPMLQ
jgi:hypothetical protein